MELKFIKSKTSSREYNHLKRTVNVQTNRHSMNNKFQSVKGVECEKEELFSDAVASFSVAREFTLNDV